jgi:hypothetical protein
MSEYSGLMMSNDSIAPCLMSYSDAPPEEQRFQDLRVPVEVPPTPPLRIFVWQRESYEAPVMMVCVHTDENSARLALVRDHPAVAEACQDMLAGPPSVVAECPPGWTWVAKGSGEGE